MNRFDPNEEPAEEPIPAEVLTRHRALLLEVAREDEARQQPKLIGGESAA